MVKIRLPIISSDVEDFQRIFPGYGRWEQAARGPEFVVYIDHQHIEYFADGLQRYRAQRNGHAFSQQPPSPYPPSYQQAQYPHYYNPRNSQPPPYKAKQFVRDAGEAAGGLAIGAGAAAIGYNFEGAKHYLRRLAAVGIGAAVGFLIGGSFFTHQYGQEGAMPLVLGFFPAGVGALMGNWIYKKIYGI